MGVRSKIEQLPQDVRFELEKRLIEQAFANYEGLSAWLKEKGYEIHKASVHRWGSKFEDRLRTLKVATEQARAIVEASPDDQGSMAEALTRLVQEKLFNVLLDIEVDPDTIDVTKLTRAIAQSTDSTVGLLKFKSVAQARAQAVADKFTAAVKAAERKGMTAAIADEIRREILGIV